MAGRSTLSDDEKAARVAEWQAKIAANMSAQDAAKAVGVGYPTLLKWRKALGGEAAPTAATKTITMSKSGVTVTLVVPAELAVSARRPTKAALVDELTADPALRTAIKAILKVAPAPA